MMAQLLSDITEPNEIQDLQQYLCDNSAHA